MAVNCKSNELPFVLIKSRDIFDELLVENQRLLSQLLFANNCVNKLKTILTQIYHKFDPQLSEEERHTVNEVTQELLQLSTKDEVKWEPIDIPVPQKHRKQMTRPTKAVDLTVKDVTTDDSVNEPIGCLSTSITTKNRNRKSSKVSVNGSDDKKAKTVKQSVNQAIGGQTRVNRLSANRLRVGDKKEKKRLIYRKSASDVCSPEELEDITQKYVNGDGIWDDQTGQHRCPKIGCSVAYTSHRCLYSHLLSLHGMQPIGHGNRFQKALNEFTKPYFDGQQYVCGQTNCGQQFAKQMTFYCHLKKDHQLVLEFVCDYCQKSYKNGSQLMQHKKTHTDDKPYKCHVNDCGFTTRTVTQLNNHLRSRHSDIRSYGCDYTDCNKMFKCRSALYVHRRTHDPNRQVMCYMDGCDQTFKNRDRRTLHIKQFHKGLSADACKPRKKGIGCEWPGCSFTGSATGLEIHKRTHTGERPFPCEWPGCDKRFRNKQYLADHRNTHLNIKPYVCHWPGCAYRSSDSGNLRKHVRTSHKNII